MAASVAAGSGSGSGAAGGSDPQSDEFGEHWVKLEQYNSCVCPLTLMPMQDPVSTVDGHTYEREAIEEWLSKNDTSPVTGLALDSKRLVPNLAIKNAMDDFFKKEAKLAEDLAYSAVSETIEAPDKQINLLVVGPSAVGKSSLLWRLRHQAFKPSSDPTYGMEVEQTLYRCGGQLCAAKVWDTSGQAHLKDTVRVHYRSADAILFVFDVTRPETLEQLEPYIEQAEMEETSKMQERILIANKIDVADQRKVSAEEGSAFADRHKLHDYREVSAKSGANVPITFRSVLTHAALHKKAHSDSVKLGAKTHGAKQPDCCLH